MITIFTHCKAFTGDIGVIQRNAIQSWLRLQPPCEVFLFGDREGTAEVAREFGVLHFPEVARNKFGAPLLNDLLYKAERRGRYELICYANCDIILGSEFTRAVAKVNSWARRFLVIGECWNLDITEPIDFNLPNWEDHLQNLVSERGTPRGPFALDYFVFRRGFYNGLPPFALGRTLFDNWLVWKARANRARVVDATPVVRAVHQNHDYAHVPGGKFQVRKGEDGKWNIQLARGAPRDYTTSDATHRLTHTGIHWNRVAFKRTLTRLGWEIVELTRPMRHLFGIRIANVERVISQIKRLR